MKKITYTLIPVENCDLCDAGNSQFKILGKRLNGSQGFFPKNKIGITTTVVKCKNCGLVFPNPMPVPAALSDHYGVPPEKYWIPEYFTVNKNEYAGLLSLARNLGDFSGKPKVLDIGAGIGKCMIAFENGGFDVWGIEPSEPFYNKAIKMMNVSPDRLRLSSLDDSEFEENYFDFITFGAVLEHLYNPSESILKAMKWLKPNGIIHIEVPNSNWLISELINLNYKVRGLDYVSNISPMHEPYHIYEFTLKSFQEHAKKHNYEIVYSEYYICNTYMPSFINPLVKWYMRKKDKGMQLAVILKKK
jgi:2-polyprenyl-3-methyl-5-hydroxy-6-metoxy-1,4-benzoquinol methylase